MFTIFFKFCNKRVSRETHHVDSRKGAAWQSYSVFPVLGAALPAKERGLNSVRETQWCRVRRCGQPLSAGLHPSAERTHPFSNSSRLKVCMCRGQEAAVSGNMRKRHVFILMVARGLLHLQALYSRQEESFSGTLVPMWEESKLHQCSQTRGRCGLGTSFPQGILSEGRGGCPRWQPGLPCWLSGTESACSAGDPRSIPGSGRSLEKEMATLSRAAWRAIVHVVAESDTTG
ncbi:uncharacterized protein LOC129647383 [Bubalus kerabau]|uniref:uncharacterized protein LOC129647383 n=1 Tax=Bubalus carabanensis TaxID=3119969 RepID=UPI00244EB1C7|nr:uncharacterized protein LOC129647383 [Bubalus carabanensis]